MEIEHFEDWKTKLARAEDKMVEAIEENNRFEYECAQNDYNNANNEITGILELINE